MMNIKGIFAVSLIAMVAMVAGAHTSNAVAAIASQGYVDQQVGSKANATDLNRKVDIYQGDAKANQAVITNGAGNITTGFITKSMLGADVEIPDEYELPPATANALGGVKSGGNITVATSGAVTVNSATKATQDASGNEITKTYATKDELPAASDILTTTTVTSSGTGAVLTGVSVTAGKVTLQKGNVQIPSGGQNATNYVSIWVE